MSGAADQKRPPQVQRLLGALAQIAAEGRALSHVERDLGALVGECGPVVRHMIWRAERRGLIKLHHQRRMIAAIEAGDGAWRVPVAGAQGTPPAVQDRRCLRCRQAFRPEHRGRFLCAGCNLYAQANG